MELREHELLQMVFKQDSVKMETKVLENVITRMKFDQLRNKQDNLVK